MFITITTVGYGDQFPKTLLGKVVIFFVCVYGTCCLNMLIIAIQNTILALTSLEDNVNYI